MFETENLVNGLDMDSGSDEDTCDNNELSAMFSEHYELQEEVTVANNQTYVLHMCGGNFRQHSSRVAVCLSDCSCAVYDINSVSKVATASGHQKALSGIRFSPKNDDLLYSCSMDGTVKLWDLRTDMKNCRAEFNDDTSDSNVFKPLTAFDVSANDRFVCAGSQLVDDDAFLLFWDARSSKLLGGYWESHSDDITQVRFHPSKQNTMATGSTDGLINIFDVSRTCEDDALRYCLNTESSVGKLFWVGADDSLSCITHTEDLQMWKIDGEAPEIQFSRENITKCLQRKSVDSCYLIDVYQEETSGTVMLLAGSLWRNGHCLRSLEVTSENLKPMHQFVNNKQIVRTSWYIENDERLITGGESGFLSIWKPLLVANGHGKSSPPKPSSMKMPSKLAQHKASKPY